jgi:hypothetical protein
MLSPSMTLAFPTIGGAVGKASHCEKQQGRQRTNVEALSGTNPDDHYGQRKGDANRTTNRQRERR